MLRIDNQHFKTAFQQVKHWLPIHASPNVTKGVLDWEYTRVILQSDLRTRTGDQRPQALPYSSSSSYEGSIPQGPGASHVQHTSSAQQALGGDGHV